MGRQAGDFRTAEACVQAKVIGDGQINATPGKVGRQCLEPADAGGDGHVGVPGGKAGKERGEDQGREIFETAKRHRRGAAGGALGQPGKVGEDTFGIFKKAAPEAGDGHRPAGAAQEQGAAHMRLKLRQRHRQRRLRDIECGSRQRHALGAADGDGVFKLAQGNG